MVEIDKHSKINRTLIWKKSNEVKVRKNKVGDLAVSDYKAHFKTVKMKMAMHWHKERQVKDQNRFSRNRFIYIWTTDFFYGISDNSVEKG